MIGQTISHYEILEKLGEGGMGVVYKAQDTKLRRPVALKFIAADMTRDQDAKKRFAQEAQAASALDHPNIAVVHEIDETDDGRSFICMTYYGGKTLKEKIAEGPLDVREAVQIVLQVASGLQRAHESGIVHRDIKPANIIMTEHGEAKIVDFGLAKLAAQTRPSRTAPTAGTAAYMSPEQVLGAEADARSDLFSLGVLFYEAVTGKRPFIGEHEPALFYSIANTEPPPPTSLRRDLPIEIERIILRLLEKDQKKRYQSAADLRENLKHFLGEKPTPRPVRIVQRVLRNRFSVPLAISGVVVIVASLLLATGVLQRWLGISRLTEPQYIGVMPFKLIGGDSTKIPLLEGIHERVTSSLIRMQHVLGGSHVSPASETWKYRGKDAREARKGSGITIAIEGSVQWLADQIMATVTVVDAKELSSIDSREVSASVASFSELEERLVSAIAEMLKTKPTSAQLLALQVGTTHDEMAYDYYIRARGELLAYREPAKLNSAIQLFQRAIALDSIYALAYAGLGEGYWRKYTITRDVQWADSAFRACRHAQTLNSGLPEVRFTLGLLYSGTGKDSLAILEFQSILADDSVNAFAWMELGKAIGLAKQRVRAEAAYRRAIDIRPFDWQTYHYLATAYYYIREYPKAIEFWNEAVKLAPNQPGLHVNLGAAAFNQRNWTDAIRQFNLALQIDSSLYTIYTNLATAYYYDGMSQLAVETYLKSLRYNSTDYRVWGGLGAAYRELGGSKLSQEAYEKAESLALAYLKKVNATDAQVISQLSGYYADMNRAAEARAMIQKALALAPTDINVQRRAVTTYELIGDRKEALKRLAIVLAQGPLPMEIEYSPEMKKLRQDPRYVELTKGGGAGRK